MAAEFWRRRLSNQIIEGGPMMAMGVLQGKHRVRRFGYRAAFDDSSIVGFEGITGETSKEINSSALQLRFKQTGLLKDEVTTGAAQAH
ncbi:hypothetical protein MJO28_008784 [Puccinia striiformis f. sp. tritici]|uniref:Uncharacterized protein n=2 Tax=Puccinia striiformis TaxID=27350 RepID=A0A2S4WH90_9BASI|nr:hypothetical protein Pst134EA_015175 [Puccinia striiformis f. sp. tritici]KAH9463089.1 hypothetical protein Pst134EA_015175 [Puccinia striiformis f. sp. tritici]KAI7949963.1 hypothetical protein MJO28_008784 [Puccinia striiformis f. sp. tritici]KAI7953030.1 hypothetical protein MJO29_008661 [Puccinia striiformis f. sp. tritici]POW21133.1 hypothetical protein PSHT_02704 [Puccinia striiformis]